MVQKKRKTVSLDMQILNQLEESDKATAIAKVYGINESAPKSQEKEGKNRSSVAFGILTSLRCLSCTRDPEIKKNTAKVLIIWI